MRRKKKKPVKPTLPEVRYVVFPKKDKLLGQWHPSKKESRLPEQIPGIIEIEIRQTPIEQFDTLIHELLHEAFRDVTESKILASANLITDVLWREGYRKVVQ